MNSKMTFYVITLFIFLPTCIMSMISDEENKIHHITNHPDTKKFAILFKEYKKNSDPELLKTITAIKQKIQNDVSLEMILDDFLQELYIECSKES